MTLIVQLVDTQVVRVDGRSEVFSLDYLLYFNVICVYLKATIIQRMSLRHSGVDFNEDFYVKNRINIYHTSFWTASHVHLKENTSEEVIFIKPGI